jgi:hypothetical protein
MVWSLPVSSVSSHTTLLLSVSLKYLIYLANMSCQMPVSANLPSSLKEHMDLHPATHGHLNRPAIAHRLHSPALKNIQHHNSLVNQIKIFFECWKGYFFLKFLLFYYSYVYTMLGSFNQV